MRKGICVPMMTLCLLFCGGCGEKAEEASDLREAYREMTAAVCEAVVTATQGDQVWDAALRCSYTPEKPTVDVLAPENIAGVRAVIRGEELTLEYEELCLDAGTVSREEISPMTCLPRLINALREGWLLEENEEVWQEEPCLRLTLDQSGKETKILSTIWLRQSDGTPVRGELSVDEEIILTAEFTSFTFCDNIVQES